MQNLLESKFANLLFASRLCSASNGKVLLRRLPCFARASKYSNIAEVFLLQFSELTDKERFCFIKKEAVVIARNV